MLITVLFCVFGLALAGDGKGYNYPKPSIAFDDGACPPGSNGVFPNCEPSQPSYPQRKCAPGYSGQYPECEKDIDEEPPSCPQGFTGTYPYCQMPQEEEKCTPPAVGTFPNCFTPPCPPGFIGTYPDCQVQVEEKKCDPPTVGTFPNCYTPPCPPGFTGIFPNCNMPSDELKHPEGATGDSPFSYLPPAPQPSDMCEMDWDQFKTVFNKSYTDINEEYYRQQIFLQNQRIIQAHNVLYHEGLETYSLCVNKFGDWLHDEYLDINGLDLSTGEMEFDEQTTSHTFSSHESESNDEYHDSHFINHNEVDGSNFEENANANKQAGKSTEKSGKGKMEGEKESPESKDWRKEGAVTPVKDQLKCASCWAFSATGALEGQFYLKEGILNSLSEQQLVDCSRRFANNGCKTGFMTHAFAYTKSDGIQTEAKYPYEGKDDNCRTPPSTEMKNKNYMKVPKGDEGKLKEAVGNIGPIAVGLDGSHDKFMFYSQGVYLNPDCDPERISHAVLAIGYDFDEESGLDYWIVKNSYGTTWGDGGYGKIARNKNNHCGIANLASYPII